jgi:hypothetical protein
MGYVSTVRLFVCMAFPMRTLTARIVAFTASSPLAIISWSADYLPVFSISYVHLRINCICIKHKAHNPPQNIGVPNMNLHLTEWNTMKKM